MILVLVHGISDDRDEVWSRRWLAMMRPMIDASIVDTLAISWEKIHESRYNPARSHRENLLRDLGALTNPQVQRHLQDQLRSLEGSNSTIWIIAHSLGSALVYQALDWFQFGQSELYVQRLITIGCPLWIPYSRITRRLTSLNVVMPRAVPLTNVGRWTNVAGRLDCVAGFGIVELPTTDEHVRCWSSHSVECYAKTRQFREVLRAG